MDGELAVLVLGAGVLGVLALTGWWVVGHPERIRAGLAWVARRPVVERVRSRYPRQWGFVGRRFAPGEAAGLTLTLGVFAVLALGLGFGNLLDSVLEGDGVAMADRPVLRFLAAHRQPWSVTTARVVTDVGSPMGAALTALVVGAVVAWLRRSWLPLLVVMLGDAGIALLNTALKHLVGRRRPPPITAVVGEHGYSFPSGHTTGTTVVWLLSAWMAGHWVITRRAGRIMVWAGALLMIVAVGATRAFLGVHFPSDVLAGWTLGAAWALVIVLAVSVWEQSRWIPAPLRGTG
ncbi:MAG TPA: phosphatase PAP2 family protein [Pseudonocardiaceae bacterium]|nr:phosphatase PAP2 family protein [Pseudonocardiaceae bacterium]